MAGVRLKLPATRWDRWKVTHPRTTRWLRLTVNWRESNALDLTDLNEALKRMYPASRIKELAER